MPTAQPRIAGHPYTIPRIGFMAADGRTLVTSYAARTLFENQVRARNSAAVTAKTTAARFIPILLAIRYSSSGRFYAARPVSYHVFPGSGTASRRFFFRFEIVVYFWVLHGIIVTVIGQK